MAEMLRLENVSRRYKEGEGQLEVFRDLNMSLQAGEIVALVGPSGVGKSSLLHMAGLLEAPSGGEIYIHGAAVSRLPEQERTRIAAMQKEFEQLTEQAKRIASLK